MKRILGLATAGLLSSVSTAAMAAVCPGLPYVFINGTIADGAQVNANLTAILGCFADQHHILDTTASTSTSTGALIVAGGTGIGGNLNVGGQSSTFVGTYAALSTPASVLSVRSNATATQSSVATTIETGNDWDNVQSVVRMGAGSAVKNAEAFGAYLSNQAASTGVAGNGVAYYGITTCEVNNCASWGGNSIVTGGSANVIDTQTGRLIIGWEWDLAAHSTSDNIQGLALLGSSLVQPAGADGFTVGQIDAPASPGSVARWTNAFVSDSGVVRTNGLAYVIGANEASGANSASQRMGWFYTDGAGVGQQIVLQVTTGGSPVWADTGTNHFMGWNMGTLVGANGSAANSPSYSSLWNYIDNAAAPQHWQMAVNTAGDFGIVDTSNHNFSVANTAFFLSPIYTTYNAAGNIPIALSTSSALVNNLSNASRETGLVNLDTAATTTFTVYQKTAGSVSTAAEFKGSLTGVNYLSFASKATGSAPTITAAGTDTNIDLVLQGQGTGTIKLGSAGTTANGTVATAMSNLGPTGSHTTIQKWFTVKDSSGNVLYIPAF